MASDNSSDNSLEPITCGICFDDCDSAESLKCNHVFHRECIEPWALACNSCPLCRASIDDTKPVCICQCPIDPLFDPPPITDTITDIMERIAFLERIQNPAGREYPPITVAYCNSCNGIVSISDIVHCVGCANAYYCSDLCTRNDRGNHQCEADVYWECVDCENGPCTC